MDKAEHTHFDHVEVEDRQPATEVSPATLKITRDSYWDNKKGILICLIINMAAFEYGLDQGMVVGFQAMPGFLMDFGYKDPKLPGGMGISTVVQQLMGSLVSLGMFLSTFFTGFIADNLGRKAGLWIALVVIVISTVIQMTAINLGGLYSGRTLLGVSNGLLLVCSQLYNQETLPSNLRSLSYTFFQFWISFGVLIGCIVNNSTAKLLNRDCYRIPLGVLLIIPVLLGAALIFLPETPRYLALCNRTVDAEKALRFLRDASYSDLQVKEEMAEILSSLEIDQATTKKAGYLQLLRKPNLKRTLTSIGLGLFSAASGVPFITQYGVYFFALSGDTHPFRDVIILTVCGIVGVLITPLFTGNIGKRPILMFGGIAQALCMLGLAMAYSIRGIDPVSGKTIIAMCCVRTAYISQS
jgi:MFS transporter, SP family, sugar:H+ symporter